MKNILMSKSFWHMEKASRFISCIVIFLSLLYCPASYADDPDAIVTLICDKRKGTFLIEESWKEMPDDAQYPRRIKPGDSVISIRGLMWAVESPDGAVTWKSKPISRTCKLKGETYDAVLKGYKNNESIQGMCGAGSPTLSLDLYRNGRRLASDLIFDKNCSSESNVIISILFDSKLNSSILLVRDGAGIVKEIALSLDQPISRERVFGKE